MATITIHPNGTTNVEGTPEELVEFIRLATPTATEEANTPNDAAVMYAKADAEITQKLAEAYTKTPERLQQEERDKAIDRAKDQLSLAVRGCRLMWGRAMLKVEYIVNREKGVVVALLRHPISNHVFKRGIARTAPGDVFNIHIGKIIALYRAYGAAVPTVYTEAPAPTEKRIGDIVEYRGERYRIVPRNQPTSDNRAHPNSIVGLNGCLVEDSRVPAE